MPYWWWILPGSAGLLALGLLAGGIGAMARNRPYRALGEIFTGGALLAAAAIILLLGLDVQTYSRLTYARPVAVLALHGTAMSGNTLAAEPADDQAAAAVFGYK